MAVVAAQAWQRPCLKSVGTGTVTPLAHQPGFLRLLHRRQVQDQGAGSPISGMGLALPLHPQDGLLQGEKKCLEKTEGPAQATLPWNVAWQYRRHNAHVGDVLGPFGCELIQKNMKARRPEQP